MYKKVNKGGNEKANEEANEKVNKKGNEKANKNANEKVSSILIRKPNGDSVTIEGSKEDTDSYVEDYLMEKTGVDSSLKENNITKYNLDEIVSTLLTKEGTEGLTPVEMAVLEAGCLYMMLEYVVLMALDKLCNNDDMLSDEDCLVISDVTSQALVSLPDIAFTQ